MGIRRKFVYLSLLVFPWACASEGFFVERLPAQELETGGTERRARSRPILRVRSEYPTAPVWRLAFVADDAGTWLYSAGFDKVVRRWQLAEDGRGGYRLEAAGTLTWPIYRGVRGSIYALDVRSEKLGHRVAMGGFGAMASQVNLLHAHKPENARALVDFPTTGRHVVWSLAFAPSGEYLLVGEGAQPGGAPANLLLWHVVDEAPTQLACTATGLREAMHVAVDPSGTHVAAAGPASTGGGFLIQVWSLADLARGLRSSAGRSGNDTGTQSVQQVKPVQTVRLRSKWPRSVRGLQWSDESTWQAATILGVVSGTVNGSTDLAGFEPLKPGPTTLIQTGYTIHEDQALTNPEIRNRSDFPLAYQYAPVTKGGQTRFDWKRTETLASGETRQFQGERAVAVRRVIGGKPDQIQPNIFPAGYRLDYATYVDALATLPRSLSVLGAWHEKGGHVLLRTRESRPGPTLADSRFDEVRCVAISPDGGYIAAAGPARVPGAAGGNAQTHAVYQIRVWSVQSGKMLAAVPDVRPGNQTAPPTGGSIANVAVAQEAGGKESVCFTIGPLSGSPVELRKKFLPYYRDAGIINVDDTADGSRPRRNAGAGTLWSKLRPDSRPAETGIVVVTPTASVVDSRGQSIEQVSVGRFYKVERNEAGQMKSGNGYFGVSDRGWLHSKFVKPIHHWHFSSVNDPSQRVGPIACTPGSEPKCGIRFRQGRLEAAAIGLADGIQIWDLNALRAGQGRRAILRSFYGHDAQVTCLDVSRDGTWCISGSADGTICCWSLKDLARRSELGVTIDGSLNVTGVKRSTPGWEAGFEVGQRVVSLLVAGREVPARDLRRAFENLIPGEELLVTVVAAGKQRRLLTPVSYDPLWILYPQHDGFWVMWSPDGYFDSGGEAPEQLASGNSRFEWHVNRGGVNASQAGVVKMAGVDFEQAFRSDPIDSDEPDRLGQIIEKLEPIAPDLPLPPEMSLALDRSTATFRIEPSGRGDRVVERAVWLNGHRIQSDQAARGVGNALRVKLPADEFRAGRNTLIGIAALKRQGAGSDEKFYFRTEKYFAHQPQQVPPSRVHYLGVGVAELPEKLRVELKVDSLKYSDDDVIAVGRALRAAARRLAGSSTTRGDLDFSSCDKGLFRVLADAGDQTPTRQNVLQSLDQMAERVQPNDFAMVMFAGHGFLDEAKDFRFVAQDGTVTRSEISERLSNFSCRTLLLLDTCHSEAASLERQVDDFSKVLTGPQILTACGRNEKSEEDASLEHGVFTTALLEALEGKTRLKNETETPRRDLDGDALVSVDELCRYVQKRTPKLIDELRIRKAAQHPQIVISASFSDSRRFPIGVAGN
jgi:WD40 repeat protein